MNPPVAIVGGGIAGLAAAIALKRADVPFRLFEAGSALGGLAKTVHDDGFTYDFGAHFVTNRLAAAVGAGAACYNVRRYGESVALRGRCIPYPLGLLADARYVASAAKQKAKTAMSREAPPRNASDAFERRYGSLLAHEIALPILEAWSGLPARELAPAVSDQLPDSIARTVWLKVAARISGRAVASGYCLSQPESPNVWHVYPRNGVATICETMAEFVADAIQYESRAAAIYIEDSKVVGVRVNDRDFATNTVISSAPLDVVARMVRGSSELDELKRFRYRPMIFVNVRLTGRSLLPDIVVWTPDKDVPYFRLTEAPAAMPSLAPAGMTTITCDIGATIGDRYWAEDDEALGEICVEHLRTVIPDVRKRYRGCRVMRTPIAYPVFALEYEPLRQKLTFGSGIAGLHLVGRNGEFRHDLMEDVYWRTRYRARRIADEVVAANRPAA